MPTDDGAPIQDLAFHTDNRPTPKMRSTLWFGRRGSQGEEEEKEESMVSGSSTASARRRFFPSNLFGSPQQSNINNNNNSASKRPNSSLLTPPRQKRDAPPIVVRNMKVWDVKMPPVKKHVVSGHMVPTVRGAARLFIQKRRRVSIEIHGPPVYSTEDANRSTISAATPVRSGKMQEFLQGGSPPQEDPPLQDKDVVFFRILKLSHDHEDSHSPRDEEDLSTLGPFGPDDMDESYVEHYSYRLEDVEIQKTHGRTCEMKFGNGNETIIRDVKFEAEKHALLFEQSLVDVKHKVQARARRLAERYRELKRLQNDSAVTTPKGTTTPSVNPSLDGPSSLSSPVRGGAMGNTTTRKLRAMEEGDVDVRILVDIVSAIDLPVTDLFSADAYIVVRLGSREVHRTRPVHNTTNPIWTVETKSMFLLEMSSEDFFASSTGGLSFVVKDFDRVGRNEVIGRVVVPHEELLKGTGDRIVYDIVPEKMQKPKSKQKHSRLVLRFREATADDSEFMGLIRDNSRKIGIYSEETILPPRPPDSKLMKRMTRGTGDMALHRVKPYPDPKDPEKTRWMTTGALQREANKESWDWVEAGSGELGKLYMEVIGCDDLPNMDVNLNPRDKTDAFVCLVFEDVVVNTDVIGDTLKPRWMPWCCRAFVFNISHPQSNLFLGVFDYDPPLAPSQVVSRTLTDVHDPIGRVTINLGRYLADTVYNLKFPLYLTEEDAVKGASRGSISVRLRMEWDRPRQAVIAAAVPPPPMYVSCARRIHWDTAHYTVEGLTGETSFSLSVLAKYVAELQRYGRLTPYAVDVGLELLLWRANYSFKVCGRTVSLPLHSMTAFIWGILIAWDFNFFPAFLAFAVGWASLAMNQHERRNASPWHRPRSYWSFYNLLFGNKMSASIEASQAKEAFDKFMEDADKKKKMLENEKKLMAAHSMSLEEEFRGDIKTAGSDEVEIDTKKKENLVTGLVDNLNLLKPIFYPVQLQLAKVVRLVRICVSVIRWDEPYLAWWITTTCFLASFLMIWIPWGLIIVWTLRVAVFAFLGPWMAIYDRCFVRRKNQTPEQQKEDLKQKVKAKYLKVMEMAVNNRTRMERAIKLKSMKKYLYGKYLVTIPHFSVDGLPTRPSLDSSAQPFDRGEPVILNIVDRKYGQHLTGDMIPTREFQLDVIKKKEETEGRGTRWRLRPRKLPNNAQSNNERAPLLGEHPTETNSDYILT